MSKKLGVFIIHGMGKQKEGYAKKLIADLTNRLGTIADIVAFKECFWADKVQPFQDRVWEQVVKHNLDARKLRGWIISHLSDPVVYLSGYYKSDKPVYGDIHDCVSSNLKELKAMLEDPKKCPIVVLAHSLGSVIMSNYFWDEQTKKVHALPHETVDTVAGFITYGSNIPLFLPPVEKLTNITFPSDNAPQPIRDAARWINVYDPDDILGYPLTGLFDLPAPPKDTKIVDVEMNVGMWPLGETPLAHEKYATDRRFQERVVKEIKDILTKVG